MELIYTKHWKKKKNYRPGIRDDFIKYAIRHAKAKRDKHWKDALNAVIEIPENGRKVKVVYKQVGEDKYKIITAFWLD